VCVVERRWWRRRRPACARGRAMAAAKEIGSSGIDGAWRRRPMELRAMGT
jgi:hypothetical protein